MITLILTKEEDFLFIISYHWLIWLKMITLILSTEKDSYLYWFVSGLSWVWIVRIQNREAV